MGIKVSLNSCYFNAPFVVVMVLLVAVPVVIVHVNATCSFAKEPPARHETPTICTYHTSVWDVHRNRVIPAQGVTKPYSELTAEERDPAEPRCTLCEQDQVEVDLATVGINGLQPVKICWVYAERLLAAFNQIQSSGEFEFLSVRGYRPGRTRGPVVDGKRTRFSNHSFGTAVDINAEHNGLYVRCDVQVSTRSPIDGCKLKHGGTWDPVGRLSTTIVPDGVVVRAISEHLGWQWGGTLPGTMKDFMHFSITGH
ncbi:MAG: M15 family metallopeptidase [Myxococcales bacterium]|nr:M15 family metallopeptidase [Myxococcales bacterium]